jgi:hypothetical protein
MRKIIAFIFVLALILNLLPQTSNAFKLSENNDSVVYDSFEGEKRQWEELYLPYAKYFKLVGKNATTLNIAKQAQAEQEENISAYTIIHKIMETTNRHRTKLFVKWERDNGYIDREWEEDFEITPSIRRELLKEIEEEEKKESEKENQKSWKVWKVGGKGLTAGAAFVVSLWKERDIKVAFGNAMTVFITVATFLDSWEAAEVKGWIKWVKGWFKKDDNDEEIKIPPLRNLPKIPANHTRVDLYSL